MAGLLGAAFERLVELMESGEGVAVKRGSSKGYQDAAELLLLAEADPTVAKRFDGAAVVAVEQAGKQHVAEPAQPPAGVRLQHDGPQGGATAAGRLHTQVMILLAARRSVGQALLVGSAAIAIALAAAAGASGGTTSSTKRS